MIRVQEFFSTSIGESLEVPRVVLSSRSLYSTCHSRRLKFSAQTPFATLLTPLHLWIKNVLIQGNYFCRMKFFGILRLIFIWLKHQLAKFEPKMKGISRAGSTFCAVCWSSLSAPPVTCRQAPSTDSPGRQIGRWDYRQPTILSLSFVAPEVSGRAAKFSWLKSDENLWNLLKSGLFGYIKWSCEGSRASGGRSFTWGCLIYSEN